VEKKYKLIARKVIISGLDNAGKTSILTALNKKYDFEEEIQELKPTIKVQYSRTIFLGMLISFWDMGGQEVYRNLYVSHKDLYFGETDLLIYVIDIQDREKFQTSLDYLDNILSYFQEENPSVHVIVTFHKYDPIVRDYEEINEDVNELTNIIKEKYTSFKIVFQQTSIYDIVSIVHLISYGLSMFNDKFLELSLVIEKFLVEFDCVSLVLFDERGIIVSEFYNNQVEAESHVKLLEAIKEHLFILKRIEEESYSDYYNYLNEKNPHVSYLHQFQCKGQKFYLSIIFEEDLKFKILDHIPDLIKNSSEILNDLIP